MLLFLSLTHTFLENMLNNPRGLPFLSSITSTEPDCFYLSFLWPTSCAVDEDLTVSSFLVIISLTFIDLDATYSDHTMIFIYSSQISASMFVLFLHQS